MKTLILTLIISLTFFNFNYAQSVPLSTNFDLAIGEPYKLLDGTHRREYYPIEGGKTISIKRVKERMILQLLDNKTLKELKRVDYRELSPQSDFHLNFEYFIQAKDKLYFISFFYDKKDKDKKVEVREIDTKTLSVSTPRVLLEVPLLSRFLYVNRSPDSSKILLGYHITPNKKNDIDGSSKEFLYVFDTETLSELWHKVFLIPHQYDNNNNIISGSRVRGVNLKKDKISLLVKNSSKPINEYDLYIVSEDEIDIREKIIPLGEDEKEFESSLEFTFFNDLSKEDYNVNYMTGKGVVSYQISSNGELVSIEKYKYSLELINDYLSKKEKKIIIKNNNPEIENLNPVSILKIANKGTLFVGESQIEERTFGEDQVTYRFKHLILTFLNLDGTVNWVKKIPKNQEAYSSRIRPFDIGTAGFLSKDKKNAYLFY